MGWTNPPVPWSELERRLSDRPYNADGDNSPVTVTGFEFGLVGLLLGLGIAMCLAVLVSRRQRPPTATPPKPVAQEPEPVG